MDLRIHNNATVSPAIASEHTQATDLSKQFSQFLDQAMTSLNGQQQEVHVLNEQFIKGEVSDPHQLLIAAQKASLSMELTVQVRNKVVEAYQEIMRMQV